MSDLLRGKFGAAIALIAVIAFFGGFYFSITTRNIIWVIFFFAFGIANVWNWRLTGKSRYFISGIVFIFAGIVGIVNTFVYFISWKTIWLVSVILFVLAVPIAALLRSFIGRNVPEEA